MTLGTILPTAKSIAANERFAIAQTAKRQSIASASQELKGCVRKVVGGEVRYYDTTDQYAIVSRQGKVIWFAVRPDGDHRI